jgi:polyisoprenoid-binding protein YceI
MSAALVALLLTAAPAARNFTLDAPASSIRYHVVHKLHRVDGSSSSLEGKAILQPDGRVLAMVRAPVATFDSGDGNRDAHMQEVMETSKFPFVVWKGMGQLDTRVMPVATGSASTSAVTMTGELDFHGIRRPQAVPLQLELRPDGTVHARGSFVVSLDAFHVERPSLLFVKVDDACRIDLDLVLHEVKP